MVIKEIYETLYDLIIKVCEIRIKELEELLKRVLETDSEEYNENELSLLIKMYKKDISECTDSKNNNIVNNKLINRYVTNLLLLKMIQKVKDPNIKKELKEMLSSVSATAKKVINELEEKEVLQERIKLQKKEPNEVKSSFIFSSTAVLSTISSKKQFNFDAIDTEYDEECYDDKYYDDDWFQNIR